MLTKPENSNWSMHGGFVRKRSALVKDYLGPPFLRSGIQTPVILFIDFIICFFLTW